VIKEKVLVVELKRSLVRSRGREFCSLSRVAWRRWISGCFDKRRAKTVMPVPRGTDLHQLYSVAPTGRALGSGACGFGSNWSWPWLGMLN